MAINEDYKDLFHQLNCVRVRYLVIGAYAVIFYTEPRYTKDIDIWVEPTQSNAKKVYLALQQFGAPVKQLTIDDLTNPEMVYQVGVEPNRIDIMMGIGGIPFARAWKNKHETDYGGEKVYMLSLEDLIQAKEIAGRSHDRQDLKILLKVRSIGGNTSST